MYIRIYVSINFISPASVQVGELLEAAEYFQIAALKETCSKLLQDQGGEMRHEHLDSLFGRMPAFSGNHQLF